MAMQMNCSNKRLRENEDADSIKSQCASDIKALDYDSAAQVGISIYLDPHFSRFDGTLKHRCSDFLVNEIDMNGNIVRLKSIPRNLPKNVNTTRREKSAENVENQVPTYASFDCVHLHNKPAIAQLCELLGEEPINKIRSMILARQGSLQLGANFSREKRTIIHKSIREAFNGKVHSVTKLQGQLEVFYGIETRRSYLGSAQEKMWSDLGGQYCIFTLYKINKDTIEAINLLSRLIKCPNKVFGYAGSKDRRACTSQKVTAHQVKAERLLGINKLAKSTICIGDVGYTDAPLKLGFLKGNYFTIFVRDVEGLSELRVNEIEEKLKKGFINYYGLQRFGTSSIRTHEVGIALLKSQWEKAVDLILQPSDGAKIDSQNARKVWTESRDIKAALNLMPANCVAEKAILHYLNESQCPNDYANALAKIPRNLRIMYVHAYQSYVWNVAVSERIRLFGDRPIVGDLVLNDCDEISTREDGDDATIVESKLVKILSEADLPNTTIYDVVMPTPGYDVIYPDNPNIQAIYERSLKEAGLALTSLRHNTKEYSLAGHYRKIVSRPDLVCCEVLHYNSVDDDVLLTDVDIIQGKTSSCTEEGLHVGLKISFSLEVAAYATMALRELMNSRNAP